MSFILWVTLISVNELDAKPMKSYRNSLQYSSVSFKKDTHIFTIKKHLQQGKLGGYNTAIESTDSF